MGRTKRRDKQPSSSCQEPQPPQYNGVRFPDDKARTRFSQLEGKKGIKERMVTMSKGKPVSTIKALKWTKFVNKEPTCCVLPIVKEFYANIPSSPYQDQVFVRGMYVTFSSKAINAYYNLKDLEDDAYTSTFFTKKYNGSMGLKDDIDTREIIDFLCMQGTTWNGTEKKDLSFPRTRTTKETRFWDHFICSRLMPTKGQSSITLSRARLNYAIQKGLTIDVGKVINRYIIETCDRTRRDLAFTGLITDLCAKANVEWSPLEEEKDKCDPRMDEPFYESLKSGNDGGANEASSSRAPRAETSAKMTMTQLLTQIQVTQATILHNQSVMQQKQDFMEQGMDALTNMMSACATHWGVDLSHIHMPTRPPIPEPTTTAMEEDKNDEDDEE